MKIISTYVLFFIRKRTFNIAMRAFLFFFCTTAFSFSSLSTFSQEKIVIDSDQTISVYQVFKIVKKQTDYRFIYPRKAFKSFQKVSLSSGEIQLGSLLEKCFMGSNYIFELTENKNILVKKKQLFETSEDSQEFVVSGIIKDHKGNPLPGANVVEKGTTNGTQTDFDGKFVLEVTDKKAVLVISYLGFKTQEVPVEEQSSISVILLEDTAGLDEIVVVGYGTVNKADVTNSISTIKSDDYEDIPVTSIEQGIAGQLAGVEITQNSGQPGQANAINIRGIGTITAGTQPLIVVDGLPLSQESSLNSINPTDIASVEVLKDAAAASIYGSRGGNGVIIITTKKGKSRKPQFNFNSYKGLQQIANRLDLMNAQEHAIWDRDARNNYYFQFNDGTFSVNDNNATREANASVIGFNPRKAIIPSYVQPWLDGSDTSGLTDTDWQDELFRNALIQNYQLSLNGGNEDLSYFISGTYFNQEGIIVGSDFERFSFRANLEAKLSRKLNVGVNLAPSLTQENLIEGNFSTSPITGAIIALPYFSAYNSDGSLAISQQVNGATEGDQSRAENPVAMALLRDDKRRTSLLQGGTFLELELIEGLKTKTYFGIDHASAKRNIFDPSKVGTRNRPAPDIPTGETQSRELFNWLVENTLTYKKKLNEKHNFNILLGYTFQEETLETTKITATDFPNDFVTTLNAGIINDGESRKTKSVLISYLARLQYDFDGKYLLTAAVRRDGSSRFGFNSRFGTFPSFSAGYRISDDLFFESETVNDLKLRASWGLTGNNQVGDFGSQALLTSSNAILDGRIQSGLSPNTSPNPNLSWEETSTVDIGFDIGFLNNKITASFDYYLSKTNDLLLEVPVPAHSGFTSSLQNIGEVENKGIELALKTNYNLGPVKATTSFNIASNKNRVLELGPGQNEILTGRNITRIGGELGASFGYRTAGIFTSQQQIDNTPSLSTAQVGEYIYVDANGDGQITSADRVVLGSVFPDYTFGFNSRFSFEDFDLSAIVQGVQGVHIHDRTISVLLYNPEGWNNGARDYFNNYYTPERAENAIYARPNAIPRDNGFYRETDILQDDASFIRIKNITLGYSLPEKVTEALSLNSLRMYISSKNPFTFSDYRGFNPEQRSGSVLSPTTGFTNYPIDKSFVFGLNVNF